VSSNVGINVGRLTWEWDRPRRSLPDRCWQYHDV